MNDQVEMGKRIRARRLELGIKLRPFAKQIGMDAGNLSRIERGLDNRDLPASVLRRMAFHLRTTVDWIVGPLSLDDEPEEERLPAHA